LWNGDQFNSITTSIHDNKEAWQQWISVMNENALGSKSLDFSYLQNRFRNFSEFTSLVAIIQRDAAIEGETNKRWSSRFVFPFGPNAIYEDLNIKNGTASREYINFGRTGELLYLMLSRSKAAKELTPYFAEYLEGKNKWDKLLRLMQPENEEPGEERGHSYLPYLSHKCFDELGDDWLSILRLNLPGFDFIEHLVTLGALHVMMYQLHVARQWLGDKAKPMYFICEVVSPKRTLIRQQSIYNFQENSGLTTKAIEAYLSTVESSEKWQSALAESDIDERFIKCREILLQEFWWGDDNDFDRVRDPHELISDLKELALKGHRQTGSNIHRIYGRNIGLISRRGTNKFRYAPNDSLLKTLIFANVEKRMELHDFLSLLFKRYCLVFGPNEAEKALSNDDFDKHLFKMNAVRLEQRLTSLGLLKRLSDGCAYVLNPNANEKANNLT